jgi:hypothetical protein
MHNRNQYSAESKERVIIVSRPKQNVTSNDLVEGVGIQVVQRNVQIVCIKNVGESGQMLF